MKQYISIFNDVYGPAIRGTSTYTAAAVRIGMAARILIGGTPDAILAEFQPNSPFASSYHKRGIDLGLAAGVLGMEPADSRLPYAIELAREGGMQINFRITPFEQEEPNAYRVTVVKIEKDPLHLLVNATEDGRFAIIQIDGMDVRITGGFYELVVMTEDVPEEDVQSMMERLTFRLTRIGRWCMKGKRGLLQIQSGRKIPASILGKLRIVCPAAHIFTLPPLLPIQSQISPSVPYRSAEELLKHGGALWQMGLKYECARGAITEEQAWGRMEALLAAMQQSVRSEPEILDKLDDKFEHQAQKLIEYPDRLPCGPLHRRIIANICAIMETKYSMGAFVAAPAASSCGCLAGTLLAVACERKSPIEELIKALFAAGMVGALLAQQAVSAYVGSNYQLQYSASASMTAAALVQLFGGSTKQALDAAAMALQNSLNVGYTTANDVQDIGSGKNIFHAMNAVSCASMVLAGVETVMPFDQVMEHYIPAESSWDKDVLLA